MCLKFLNLQTAFLTDWKLAKRQYDWEFHQRRLLLLSQSHVKFSSRFTVILRFESQFVCMNDVPERSTLVTSTNDNQSLRRCVFLHAFNWHDTDWKRPHLLQLCCIWTATKRHTHVRSFVQTQKRGFLSQSGALFKNERPWYHNYFLIAPLSFSQ